MTASAAGGSEDKAWECSVADVLRQSCLLLGACADGQGDVQDVCGSCGAVEATIGQYHHRSHGSLIIHLLASSSTSMSVVC